MRHRTAQLLTRLLQALAPSHGRHRRTTPHPLPPPAPVAAPPAPQWAEPPLWDTPLIRPYLTAYEQRTYAPLMEAVA